MLYTLESIPVMINENNVLIYDDIDKYYNELINKEKLKDIENKKSAIYNKLLLLLDDVIYDTIIGYLLKLSGISYEDNNEDPTSAVNTSSTNVNDNSNSQQKYIKIDIKNILSFYTMSYKKNVNANFILDSEKLVNKLYEVINKDITDKNSVLIVKLLNKLKQASQNIAKKKFIDSISEKYPFLFIGISEESDKYQYLIRTLEDINDIFNKQQIKTNDPIQNIIAAIQYRDKYNRSLSKYQMFLQHYKQPGAQERSSERISVLLDIIHTLHTFGITGGKKTSKIYIKKERKTIKHRYLTK